MKIWLATSPLSAVALDVIEDVITIPVLASSNLVAGPLRGYYWSTFTVPFQDFPDIGTVRRWSFVLSTGSWKFAVVSDFIAVGSDIFPFYLWRQAKWRPHSVTFIFGRNTISVEKNKHFPILTNFLKISASIIN